MTGPGSTTRAAAGRPYAHRWRTLALLGVAQFMLIVDVTVVAIALPHMGADLGLSRVELTWVTSAYTLVFGGLMVLGGRLADLVGPRRLVLGGLAVFTAASLVAGFAAGGAVLLAGRVAQGVGAAMLSPAALSAVVRMFEGDERNRALGVWSAMGGAGGAVGVLLGGLLAGGPGWPWVFFVNVPVGAAVLAVLLRLLPALPGAAGTRRGRVDVLGAVLVTASTGAHLRPHRRR
jgi:MFS family permease